MTDPTPPSIPQPGNGTASTGAAPTGGAPASSPRRDRMLSELAGELRAARDEHRRDVEQLRADLTGLSTLVGDNADLLAQALPRVSGLDDELADLAERVDILVGAVNDLAGAGPAEQDGTLVDWPSLTADDAAAEWQALGDWVALVLGPFYELTRAQLPDCWPMHRPAVIELVWLRRAYVAAHRPDALPSARADWHTRWRCEALANIATAIPAEWCGPGQHYIHKHDHNDPRDQARSPRPPGQMKHVRGQRPTTHNDPYARPQDEVTTPEHWGPAFQLAAGADIQGRRQRDAAAATDPPAS